MKRSLRAGVTGPPSLASLVTIANAILRTSPRGLFDVLAPLRSEELYSLVESDDFFVFVLTQYVDTGGRGTSCSMSSRTPGTVQSPLAPLGSSGRWQCRLLAVRVSSPCRATSASTLVRVFQSVPQLRAVPNVLFSTLTCHRDDSGVSGHRVSFTLSKVQHAHSGRPPARGWRATTARKGSWCRGAFSKP